MIKSEPELVEEEENQQDGDAAAVSVVCYAGIDIGCQTDTTVNDLHALEIDHQLRIQESVLTAQQKELDHVPKGYPDLRSLRDNDKVLRFYTGLTSFTVLMAVFYLVASVIPE